VASLDPLARREFLQDLMEAVAEQELSVVLSSHLVADLERVCDYLIVLIGSQVRVAGPVDELLAAHPPAHRPPAGRRARCRTACRSSPPATPTCRPRCWCAPPQDPRPAWTVSEVALEDLVLGYMSQAAGRRRRDNHRYLEVQK